jgi:hypothetical protein
MSEGSRTRESSVVPTALAPRVWSRQLPIRPNATANTGRKISDAGRIFIGVRIPLPV